VTQQALFDGERLVSASPVRGEQMARVEVVFFVDDTGDPERQARLIAAGLVRGAVAVLETWRAGERSGP